MSGGGAALSHIPDSTLLKFVHHVIDYMCGGEAVSYEVYKKSCPLDKFWLAIQEVKSAVKDVAARNLTKTEAVDVLSPLGDARAEIIHDAVVTRRKAIEATLVRDALHKVTHLTDFDWNVRLAVSSDKVMELNELLVSLRLHTAGGTQESTRSTNRGGGLTRDICVEMTPPQLDSLLHTLQQAQDTLNSMASQPQLSQPPL